MQVLPINNYNYTKNGYNAPSFNANNRWIYGLNNKPLYKTTTGMLRTDLNWEAYVRKLCNKHSLDDKVNVMIHACSNGMEAMSLLLAFLVLKPKEVDKFCPLLAKDIDYHNIEIAKNGRVEVTKEDIARINRLTDNQTNKFFNCNIFGDRLFLIPCNEIRDRIIYEQGDVFNDIEKIPNQKSVLHVRNMWQYMSLPEREALLKKMSDRFCDSSSTVVFGDYDFDYDFESMLNYYGFEEDLLVKNVYSKDENFHQYATHLY